MSRHRARMDTRDTSPPEAVFNHVTYIDLENIPHLEVFEEWHLDQLRKVVE